MSLLFHPESPGWVATKTTSLAEPMSALQAQRCWWQLRAGQGLSCCPSQPTLLPTSPAGTRWR